MLKQKMVNNIKLIGSVRYQLWDAEKYPSYTSIIRARHHGVKPEKEGVNHNIVVTVGLQHIINILIGTEGSKYIVSECGVGSGSTTPDVGDTDLETAIGSRKTITDKFRTNQTGTFSTFYNSSSNNGTWREAALFWLTSGSGDMICHALFASAFTKDSSKTAVVDWDLAFTSA